MNYLGVPKNPQDFRGESKKELIIMSAICIFKNREFIFNRRNNDTTERQKKFRFNFCG